MIKLLNNSRFYILLSTVSIAISIYIFVQAAVPQDNLKVIRLTQIYAITAVAYLYLALVIGPLTHIFSALPYKNQLIHARRAIGVSAFFFALLHANLAFFVQLGGLVGLGFLSTKYLQAIILSFGALVILTLMASTSSDFMVSKLTYEKWKALHRMVYIAGLLILIHALMLGTHFQDLSTIVPRIFAVFLVVLFILEGLALDKFLNLKFKIIPKFGFGSLGAIIVLIPLLYFSYAPKAQSLQGFNIHQQHIQIAQENQVQQNQPTLNIPSLVGDRTKRYTVSFEHPENILPNTSAVLKFKVFDASSGNPVLIFQKPYEKSMHLIIVNDELTYYDHIHPEQISNEFEITTSFPKIGRYHLYVDFQPLAAIEQQMAFTLDIGNFQPQKANQSPYPQIQKTVENYIIKASGIDNLNTTEASVGLQKIIFTITDINGNAITNLKPYLSSFGHLVMINRDTYDYLHVHSASLIPPKPGETSGPNVEFIPIGLYGPIKPGVYRAFLQINPDGNLITSEFTIEIK